jgi:hypothetical protein
MTRKDYGCLKTISGHGTSILSSQDSKVINNISQVELGVRSLMDGHMTYDKERMLKNNMEVQEEEDGTKTEKKKDRFIWSYIIKPVRKDYNDDK